MARLTVPQCRKLIRQAPNQSLTNEDVLQLRDMLYSLADVIADAFIDLANMDQATFQPSGDVVDWFERGETELIRNMPDEETQ